MIELSEGLATDAGFQKSMITVIYNCLRANIDPAPSEAIFDTLALSRATLAFVLLQRLTDIAPESSGAKDLLEASWATLQRHVTDLGIALASNDGEYVRTVLRIMLLSLHAHLPVHEPGHSENAKDKQKIQKATTIALEVLGLVVARGFRSLINQLHEDPSQVLSGDFALLIAIMRTALQVPGVTDHAEKLLTYFADERTSQYVGTLLSWSDQLMTDGDPIYGELSVSFLMELSVVPALAESIVVSGTFAQVSTTTLFSCFRKPGGSGPFEHPPRLYRIWSRGFLPLTVNILSAIGAPIVSEIATTLNQFSPQLALASGNFDIKPTPLPTNATTGIVTSSMAAEAHSLALISTVVNKFREAGSSAGIIPSEVPELAWDAASVREDIESRMQRRNNLRESIVPTNEREEAWLQQKAVRTTNGSENRLEEKIVEELVATLALFGAGEA